MVPPTGNACAACWSLRWQESSLLLVELGCWKSRGWIGFEEREFWSRHLRVSQCRLEKCVMVFRGVHVAYWGQGWETQTSWRLNNESAYCSKLLNVSLLVSEEQRKRHIKCNRPVLDLVPYFSSLATLRWGFVTPRPPLTPPKLPGLQ